MYRFLPATKMNNATAMKMPGIANAKLDPAIFSTTGMLAIEKKDPRLMHQ